MLSGGQSVAAGLDEVVPDWRDRALQERIVTVTVIASSVYMAIVFLCVGWLMSFGPAWVVFTVLLGLIWVMMASLQGFRVLRWRRRPEHYPPVSGWGVVTDGQAAMVLLVTLFLPGYALYLLLGLLHE